MSSEVEIFLADLQNADHARAIVRLTNAYAEDPLGNGEPLPKEVLARLVPGLKAQPTALVFLALANRGGADDAEVGIATCFGGFSSFAARPLINVHDLYVRPEFRGQGVARRLLEAVEAHARATGCCKLTLEVLENNTTARGLYASRGFAQAVYTEAAGGALFYAKPLEPSER